MRRALAPDGVDGRLLVAGSGVAALAFLTRQQGALIVPAVVLFLLLSRRLRFDRASLVLLVQLVALPLLAVGGYYLWLRYGNDVPQVQIDVLPRDRSRRAGAAPGGCCGG